MATIVENHRFTVVNTVRLSSCEETPTNSSTQNVGSRITKTAVFSRPKPKRLHVTSFQYRDEIAFDPRTSDCKKHEYGTLLRAGSLQHCHNSMSGSLRTFSSEGQISEAATLARSRFISNSYAETLAESRQTANMVSKRITDLARLADSIRRGDFRRTSKIVNKYREASLRKSNPLPRPTSRHFADAWLEYQFGWKPILSDIYDLMGYYRNRLEVGMEIGRTASTNGGFGANLRSKPPSAAAHMERIHKHGPTAKVAIRGRVTNPHLRTLSEMGLTNPLSLAWDLLPYSFVIDWVLPISTVFRAMLYGVGLSVEGSYSVSERGRYTHKAPSCCGVFVTSYDRRVNRTPMTSPRISFLQNPRDLGLWHIITSTALLRQSMSGGR